NDCDYFYGFGQASPAYLYDGCRPRFEGDYKATITCCCLTAPCFLAGTKIAVVKGANDSVEGLGLEEVVDSEPQIESSDWLGSLLNEIASLFNSFIALFGFGADVNEEIEPIDEYLVFNGGVFKVAKFA
ncbi:unnamed protein product, partial [marine sediment metagenome]